MQKQKNENCKIFIGGLPHGVTDDEVKQFFQRFGPVCIIFKFIIYFKLIFIKFKVREFKMMFDDVKKRPRGKIFSIL
jgi:RNA recognition motif-containing protein